MLKHFLLQKRFWPTLGLVLSLGVLLGCREQSGEAPAALAESKDLPPMPEQQFFDYRLVESKAGVPQWVLSSHVMNKYGGQRDVELVTVHMDFYQEGKYFSTLTSDSGRANLQTNDIFTWGQVVITTEDGRKLETEELYFDNAKQLIHNDVFDRFTRESDVVEGIGLEASPDLEYIEIKQEVAADVLDQNEPERERP